MITQVGTITIVGSSHISKQSLQEVKTAFKQSSPLIIAIELDKKRLQSIYEKERKGPGISAVGRIGVHGYLFTLIGSWVQRKLGNMVGVAPGSEMKLAAKLAKENKKTLALIDQDIEITLRRFSKMLTWREKFRMMGDLAGAVFSRKQFKELEKRGFDLNKVPDPELIDYMMEIIEKRYPNIYKTLIHERNLVMARNLHRMQQEMPSSNILAVMGAGHVKGVVKELERLNRKQLPK